MQSIDQFLETWVESHMPRQQPASGSNDLDPLAQQLEDETLAAGFSRLELYRATNSDIAGYLRHHRSDRQACRH